MLAVTVIENTVLSAFGIFKSVSCLIRMRLRKNFFFKHVLLSFSSTLSPRSYLENACCNCYKKHAFGIFKSISCLILMRLRKNFFFKHVLLLFSSTLSPRSCLENACCNCYQKHPFGIFKSVSCLIRMRLRKNKFSNMFFYHFLQLCSRGHVSKMLAVTVIKNTPLEFSNPFPALF